MVPSKHPTTARAVTAALLILFPIAGALGSCSATSDATTTTAGAADGPTTGATGTATGGGAGGSLTVSSSTGTGEGGGGAPPCAAGTIVCDGTIKKVCDGNGGFTDELDCAPGSCVAGFGCGVCSPGSYQCNGNTSEVCVPDGSDWQPAYVCDPVQGVQCNPQSGQCEGACAPANLGESYIGCEYYPTITANSLLSDESSFHFAVAVANTTANPAFITIFKNGGILMTQTVPPNDVAVITLPWDLTLKNSVSATTMVPGGAYWLRSDQPVTVYQYNPLEYASGGGNSYTNDASLLLPVSVWTGNYRVAARNTWIGYPGEYAVTASQANTTVTITPSSTGGVVLPGAGIAANGTGTVVLQAGDVLQVFSGTGGSEPDPSDLTGTLITADKPVQVIGGHNCTDIPYNITACDHIEEAMFPLETLGTTYIATAPLIPTGGNVPKVEMVRMIATEAGTTLTYDPPQPGAPANIANAGDYVEIAQTAADFQISANHKIIVIQYMEGQDAGGGSGDPASALAVPSDQYRTSYLFHAPLNYEKNFVNVMAPLGTTIDLDGASISSLVAIGNTGFGVVRIPLPNNVNGNHSISANAAFGISVYGYGQYTSYWYPGGLDLTHL